MSVYWGLLPLIFALYHERLSPDRLAGTRRVTESPVPVVPSTLYEVEGPFL